MQMTTMLGRCYRSLCRIQEFNIWYPNYQKRLIGAVRSISGETHGDNVIGIDLGTTYSRVAVMEGLIPMIVESESGRAIPSFVAINEGKEVFVGDIAKQHAMVYPASTLFKMKHLIGRQFDDPQTQKLLSMVPYKILKASNGEAWVEVGTEQFSPTRASASILRKMKELTERYLMKKISKAVIAVPVYFNDKQRQEIEEAGRIAGLDVLRVVDEQIMAIISSCKSMNDCVVAVFDLGGGTFDVSILEISNGIIKVKARNGDNFLGGEDFDHALVKYFVDEIRQSSSVDVSEDQIAMMRLMEAAEIAKIELSSAPHADICVHYIAGTVFSPVHLKITLTRPKFEEIVRHLIERTRVPCQNCLKNARFSAKEIDEVIMIGGMAKVPLVQETVKEIFGKPPSVAADPDEAVAIGAAIHGGFIVEDGKEALLPNVTPLSLGVETSGGIFTRVINRNTRISTRVTRTFSTDSGDKKNLCLRIFQGEGEMAFDNKLLGELKLTGIHPAPQGLPRILVTFEVDANGVLTVSAKDEVTGREQAIIVQPSGELTEECVRKAVKQAMLHGRRDREKAALIEIRKRAAILINMVDKIVQSKKGKVPEEEILDTEEALYNLKVVIGSEDAPAVKRKIHAAELAARVLVLWKP